MKEKNLFTTLGNKIEGRIRRILKSFGYLSLKVPRYGALTAIFYFSELYNKIEHIEGDIVECGVGYGNSLVVLAALAKQEGKGRRVYGFDSFEGFPKDADREIAFSGKSDFRNLTLDKVKRNFHKIGMREPILVKGFFKDTLDSYEGSIAFLHIDVDAYGSYKTVLEKLFCRVAPQGVVAFDEYNSIKWPGATKAIDGFFQGKYEIRHGKYRRDKYYVVKR